MVTTEREAWLELAVWWSKAKPYGADYATLHGTGICPNVVFVAPSSTIRESMNEKLRKYLPERHTTVFGHRWSTNRHGARSRALFCLRMASMCE